MIPVISSPTRSRYSSNIMSRSASRIRWRITCLAVCAAIRPKSCGVTSRVSIWSSNSARRAGSMSGASGMTISPVSGSTRRSSSVAASSASSSSCSSRSGGSSSSSTRKSPESRSIRTRAYRAAPGCFLYADRRASSKASMSFSSEMPFSRPSTRTASTISCDMRSVSQKVRSMDVRVRDRDHPSLGGDGDAVIARVEQLAGERAPPVVLAAGAHPRAPADEAAEVLRLGERALHARRGDLERVLLADLGKLLRDPLAQLERDAGGVVDEEPDEAAGDDLGEQDLDLGFHLREACLDVG